ncbi:MAG TPA: hypothetical protein VIW28_06085 [Gemmatimonadales bacterium]
MRRLAEAVLGTPGDSAPALRRAVEQRAASIGGRAMTTAPEVPPQLLAYVDTVARHAYRTTDELVAALKRAGYSEDAIFELTLSAALGAGMARLERGLAALGGRD